MWIPRLTVAPALEPLTLDEVKDHRRITSSDADPDLDRLIVAVREQTESELSIALLTQTRTLTLDCWPCTGRIYLPRPPLQSVSSISYKESTAGTPTTWSSSLYTVYGANTTPGKEDHKQPAYITPAYGQYWPSLYPVPQSVTITYVCGWLTIGAIPEPIRQAMLVTIGDLDEQREDILTGTIQTRLGTIEALLVNHRCVHEFGSDCG